MKILQIGLGSMGKRRIRNFQALGLKDIVGFDFRNDRRDEAEKKYKIKTIDVLDGEGDSHTYVITEDTDMPEKIQVGMTVEVSGAQIVAVKIEVLSE